MSFENNYSSGSKFEEASGVALEKEIFGDINLDLYKELVVKLLATKELEKVSHNLKLKDIKFRNRELYNSVTEKARSEYLHNLRNPVLDEAVLFEIIKQCQPGRKPSLFIVDLKKSLAEKLGVEVGAISFYSSLGTNADFCGVDGIFTINTKSGSFDVSVDITLKSEAQKSLEIKEKIAGGGKYWGNVILSFDGHEANYSPERDADLLTKFTNKINEYLSNYC